MIGLEPAIALVVALLFGLLLVGALGWRYPRHASVGVSLTFVLLLLFPLLWVAALWAGPVGPTLFGVAFVPILLMGLLLALVAAVLVAPVPPRRTREAEGDAAVTAFGALFWILILVSIGMIVLGYMT